MISLLLRSSSRDGYSACVATFSNCGHTFDEAEIESLKATEIECALRCLVAALQKLRTHTEGQPRELMKVAIVATCSDLPAKLKVQALKPKTDKEKMFSELSAMARSLLGIYGSWDVALATSKSR